MNDLQAVLAEFSRLSTPTSYDESIFRLASTVESPATPADIAGAGLPDAAPVELRQLWLAARSARLFEDVDYGQWGLVLLSPAQSAERTAREQRRRPEDYRPGDVVFAEFLGDSDLLVASPGTDGTMRVLVALPLDPRQDWVRLHGSLAEILRRFLDAAGEKYWSTGSA